MRLLVAALVVGVALAACGNDSSPLAEDPASAPAQPEAQQEAAAEAPSQEEPSPSEPLQQAEEAEQPQAEPDQAETPDTDDSAEPLPSEIVGSHKGIRSERNLLGDPDAPVEIRYFGDFT